MNAQTEAIAAATTEAPPLLQNGEAPAMRGNALVVRRETLIVESPIDVLDTRKFEHMQRVASVMAQCGLVPDALLKGGGNATANCFMVVNQAVRWGMDPFAVAQCVSVIHGKLCYEGKLIAAVIDAKLGIRLGYEWAGDGENMSIVVSGRYPDEGFTRTVEGNVRDWKTVKDGSPWTPKQYKKMLAYRGAREWARLHAPGIMLGVYSDDELDGIADEARALRARDVTDRPRPPNPSAPAIEHKPVPAATAVAEAKPAQASRPRPPNPNAPAVPAAKPAEPGSSIDPARDVKGELLDLFKTWTSSAECFAFAQRIEARIEGLAPHEKTEVRKAYINRQQELVGG